jgi:hypothetical protein
MTLVPLKDYHSFFAQKYEDAIVRADKILPNTGIIWPRISQQDGFAQNASRTQCMLHGIKIIMERDPVFRGP